MELRPDVKQLFLFETKDDYSFPNFDEIYFMMQKIIEYKIDVPGIEGLSERVPYALNKIAEGKLTRQDIYTIFPIIWTKYEAYVKKILYITDPKAFSTLSKDSSNALAKYLKSLGISVYVEPSLRTTWTQTFFKSTKLRNIESHSCESWSIKKCYNELSLSLLSYLLVTAHCLPQLKSSIKTGNQHAKIPLYSGNRFSITSIGFFDLLFYKLEFPGIDFSGIREIHSGSTQDGNYTCRTYDRDGLLVASEFSDTNSFSKYHSVTNYEIKPIDNSTFERIGVSKSESQFFNDDTGIWGPLKSTTENESFDTYRINYNHELISIIRYEENRKTKEKMPKKEIEIVYLPDGAVDINNYQYSREKRQDRCLNNEPVKKLELTRHYNDMGLLISSDKPYRKGIITESSYLYDSSWSIERVDYYRNGYCSYETINDELFITRFEENQDEGHMIMKASFKDGKLVKSTYYSIDKETGEEKEDITVFEYYSNDK